MDVLTKEQRSKNMKAIKNKNSKIEQLLGMALWNLGYRYRKNDKTVFGKPDFVYKKHKIAIFVDSEFFHGKDWETSKHRIKTNTEFWQAKIEKNIARDRIVDETLSKNGWKVIRFWGEEIKKKLYLCVKIIITEIERKSVKIHGNKAKA